MNMFKDLVEKNRSYRRFWQEENIDLETLKELIGLARIVPSGANAQALKYMPVNSKKANAALFSTIVWAAALKDWEGPKEGERPSAYIIVLCNLSIGKNKQTDVGIAAQTILLGAVEKGLGGCMLGNIKRTEIAEAFGIDTEKYSIELVIALGKPKEDVRITKLNADGSTTYYRDENMVHYVPKRSIDEIIIESKY